jgi:hypothetical protein
MLALLKPGRLFICACMWGPESPYRGAIMEKTQKTKNKTKIGNKDWGGRERPEDVVCWLFL